VKRLATAATTMIIGASFVPIGSASAAVQSSSAGTAGHATPASATVTGPNVLGTVVQGPGAGLRAVAAAPQAISILSTTGAVVAVGS
jgi:hypothetical protein